MQRRHILKFAAALVSATLFNASAFAEDAIKIGATGGPHAQIMEVVKQVVAKNGLKITVIEFSGYVQPNAALAAGDLDANSYQHAPYLDAQVKDRGYKLVKVADTVTFPMGIYSKKIKSLAELQNGARIAVPNDPTNGGRLLLLLLLQTKGLIKLRANAGLKGDAARYRREPEEAENRRTRCHANPARARQCRRRRDQYQFRDGSGPQAEDRRYRDRGFARSVCEHYRDSRGGQGQAVGRETRVGVRVGVSLERSEAVYRRQVRRRGDYRLVEGILGFYWI